MGNTEQKNSKNGSENFCRTNLDHSKRDGRRDGEEGSIRAGLKDISEKSGKDIAGEAALQVLIEDIPSTPATTPQVPSDPGSKCTSRTSQEPSRRDGGRGSAERSIKGGL